MKKLIELDAAIDALEKVAELFPWRVPGKSDTYDNYNEAWNDAIGRAEMEIESLPSAQPGWIPCDRELPRPNEEDGNGFYKAYLVQDGRWMDVARWDGKYWVAWGYSTVLLNVVAWCELPKPWEGEEHGTSRTVLPKKSLR